MMLTCITYQYNDNLYKNGHATTPSGKQVTDHLQMITQQNRRDTIGFLTDRLFDSTQNKQSNIKQVFSFMNCLFHTL